jgi:hypothetical protein
MARLRWTILPLCVALWCAACGPKSGSVPAVCAACESDGDAGPANLDTVASIDTPELADLVDEPGTDAGQQETAGVDVSVAVTACDDGDPCTTDTGKLATGCVHDFACDDADPCTSDYCSVTGTCSHAAASLPCSGTCTTKEVCASDLCHGKATPGNWVRVFDKDDFAPIAGVFAEPDGGATVFRRKTIVRLDGQGNLVKAVACPLKGGCSDADDVLRQPDGTYVLHDYYTLQGFNSSYQLKWTTELFGPYPKQFQLQLPMSSAVSADGRMWVASYERHFPYPCGSWSSVTHPKLQRVSAAGELLWTKFYDEPGTTFGSVVDVENEGAALSIVSNWDTCASIPDSAKLVRVDGTGIVLWSKIYVKEGYLDLTAAPGGFFAFRGFFNPNDISSIDRLDASGSVLWSFPLEIGHYFYFAARSTGFSLARAEILTYDMDGNLRGAFGYKLPNLSPSTIIALDDSILLAGDDLTNLTNFVRRSTAGIKSTVTGCSPADDCDDDNPCTVDVFDKACSHVPLADGTPCSITKVCSTGACK